MREAAFCNNNSETVQDLTFSFYLKNSGQFYDSVHWVTELKLTPWSRIILDKLINCPANQEVPHLFQVHYHDHKILPLNSVLSLKNPVHILIPCLFKIHCVGKFRNKENILFSLFYKRRTRTYMLLFYIVIPWLLHIFITSVHELAGAICEECFQVHMKSCMYCTFDLFIICKSLST